MRVIRYFLRHGVRLFNFDFVRFHVVGEVIFVERVKHVGNGRRHRAEKSFSAVDEAESIAVLVRNEVLVGELLENLKLLVRSICSCRCSCRCCCCCGASRRAACVFRIEYRMLTVSLKAAGADAFVVAVKVVAVRVGYAFMLVANITAGALETVLERL